jgi:Mechanosensitive ion channel, conserved TM helix
MDNFLQRAVIEPLERFLERILQFLPNLLSFILILVSGIVLGFFLKIFFSKFFRAIRLDGFSERSGMADILQKGGIMEPVSLILSRLIGWLTVTIFVFISLRSLDIPAIEQILERFILYLPNVFVAALILFFGYLLSNFLGRAALIAAVNAGWQVSGLAGKLVKLTVFLLAVTMALEQLGIGRGTIVIAFAIIFGGVVLALSIAFGLGGRDIAKDYLERKIKGEEKKDEISHL